MLIDLWNHLLGTDIEASPHRGYDPPWKAHRVQEECERAADGGERRETRQIGEVRDREDQLSMVG